MPFMQLLVLAIGFLVELLFIPIRALTGQVTFDFLNAVLP